MNALDSFLNKNSRRAKAYTEAIEEMMGDSRWRYAESTLLGILQYIEDNDSVTDAQMQAVENIRAKPSSPYGKRRRY